MSMTIISEVIGCKQVETVHEFAVMVYLADWADTRTRQVSCAHSQIAKGARMTRRGVINVLHRLQDKGVVQVTTHGGARDSNLYTILPICSSERGSPLPLWKTPKKANREVNGVHTLPKPQEEKKKRAHDIEDVKKDEDAFRKGIAFLTPGSSAHTDSLNGQMEKSGDPTTDQFAPPQPYMVLWEDEGLPCRG